MDTHPSRVFPVIALREGVVFPHTDAVLTFGRPRSSAGIHAAFAADKQAVFVAQRQPVANPEPGDLYEVGTLCVIEQVVSSGNELFAVVRGISRVKLGPISPLDPFFVATVEPLPEPQIPSSAQVNLARQIISEYKKAFDLGKSMDFLVFMRLMSGVSAAELADQIANSLDLITAVKQELLQTLSVNDRLEKVLQHLSHEVKVMDLERPIASKTQAKFERNMREQILRERKRTIQDELKKMGSDETEEDEDSDLGDLKRRIKAAKMPVETRKKAEKELSRLSQMNPNNPESNYIRTYLDWLADMPWGKLSPNHVSISSAAKVLDADHYGLKKVKERIVEYLAVMKLRQKQKTTGDGQSPTILCFAGPPGVGKTSIGKSIARALGRKFVRVSLGGIRDEAEIRGHRRTYVGAMPGRIIQGIKNAGTRNPVFMLDEIDKLGNDFRGDPSSALLEALDPEQNNQFSDHYLEVPFDLSQVMFITTANMLETIPPALRDRLEVITFPGYTLDEKHHIAVDYLWPKQVVNGGLSKTQKIETAAIKEITRRYTREAGVRDLERNLAKIVRKRARQVADRKRIPKIINLAEVKK